MSDAFKGTGSKGAPANVRVDVMKSGTYDGRELKPFDGRPGAMDAYKLPSRTAAGLVPAKGAKPCNP